MIETNNLLMFAAPQIANQLCSTFDCPPSTATENFISLWAVGIYGALAAVFVLAAFTLWKILTVEKVPHPRTHFALFVIHLSLALGLVAMLFSYHSTSNGDISLKSLRLDEETATFVDQIITITLLIGYFVSSWYVISLFKLVKLKNKRLALGALLAASATLFTTFGSVFLITRSFIYW